MQLIGKEISPFQALCEDLEEKNLNIYIIS